MTSLIPIGQRKIMRIKKLRLLHLLILVLMSLLCYVLYLTGLFEYPLQLPFVFFAYPLDVDLRKVIDNLKADRPPGIEPINAYNYDNIIDNPVKCQDKNVFVLFIVKSALNHFVRRAFIRRTWGREHSVLGKEVLTMFMVGTHTDDNNLQRDILKESKHFHDIVQDDFIDNYWNNTRKMMMGFQWAISNCRQAKYAVFVDDDFYISPENLVSYLTTLDSGEDFITGWIWDHAVPLRYKWTKWYTPLWEYPYWKWPPYPAAGAFALPLHTAVDICIAMHYTKFLRFDDVFVGIVAWKLGIPMRARNDAFRMFKLEYSPSQYKDLIASHGYDDPNELMDVWRLQYPSLV